MPYDPRMLQMARMGVNMMGPQAGPFDRTNQPKQWWEQPLPQAQQRPSDDNPSGQPANQPANPSKPQPSLLQMLMLGGPATYSGTPTAGAASSGYSPWGWLGSMGMPGGAGWGGGKS